MFIDLTNFAALPLIPYLLRKSPIVFFDENIRQTRIVVASQLKQIYPKESTSKLRMLPLATMLIL